MAAKSCFKRFSACRTSKREGRQRCIGQKSCCSQLPSDEVTDLVAIDNFTNSIFDFGTMEPSIACCGVNFATMIEQIGDANDALALILTCASKVSILYFQGPIDPADSGICIDRRSESRLWRVAVRHIKAAIRRSDALSRTRMRLRYIRRTSIWAFYHSWQPAPSHVR